MDPSSNAKAAARELARTWGAKPKVFRHWDKPELHHIDVASCNDTPVEGCVGVGTVGLSDHDLGLGQVRIELVGAFPRSFIAAPNIAATCAFNAFKDGVQTRPDSIHVNVISLYRSTGVPHVLLTDPFLWADGPQTLDDSALKIAWLMMVPVSALCLRKRSSRADRPV